MDEINDAKFLQQLQAGDQVAYKLLFNRIFPKLCAFISRFGVNDQDAEEITVDTMLKVHKAVRTFDPDGGAKLTTWIFEIAKNKVIDYKRRPAPPELRSLDSERDLKDEQALQQDDGLSPNPNILRLRRALDSLGPEDQDILRTRQVMSYEEIAEVTNASVGALRVRHNRAVNRLKKAFEEEKNG